MTPCEPDTSEQGDQRRASWLASPGWRLPGLMRELVRLRAHLPDERDQVVRVLYAASACAQRYGNPDLQEAVTAVQASVSAEAMARLVGELARALYAISEPGALVITRDADALRRLQGVFAQAWIEPVHLGTRAELRDHVVSNDQIPRLVLVDLDLPEDEGLELLAELAADVDLHALRVVTFGGDDSWLRFGSEALGAIAHIDTSGLDSAMMSSLVDGLFGIVEGASLVALEDPRTRLPPMSALHEAIRAEVERYTVFRSSGWCLVGVHVRNAEGATAVRQEALVHAAIDRVRSATPDEGFLGRLGPASFAVLLSDTDSAEVVERVSDPPAGLQDMYLDPDERPELVLAGICGGIAGSEGVTAALKAELRQATSAVIERMPRVGRTRATSVLVIEDDPVAAKFLDIALRPMGIAPVWRTDGASGLAELERNPAAFAAVVLDLHLPGMSGFEVLDTLRASPELASMPVLVLTGSEQERHEFVALDRGANDFVYKPVRPDVLVARLRRLVGSGAGDDSESS